MEECKICRLGKGADLKNPLPHNPVWTSLTRKNFVYIVEKGENAGYQFFSFFNITFYPTKDKSKYLVEYKILLLGKELKNVVFHGLATGSNA